MATFLEQEIHSQPDVIARLLDLEIDRSARIVAQLPRFDYALIAARGTSDHAAAYAKYAWAALAGCPVARATPSLHTLYDTPPRMTGALVVASRSRASRPTSWQCWKRVSARAARRWRSPTTAARHWPPPPIM